MQLLDYSCCKACPRQCGVDRYISPSGYCKTGDYPQVASVCIHQGEEPVLSGEKGICNVFFSHCNLQCVYCQNFQISRNDNPFIVYNDYEKVVAEICLILDQGINHVGFVSPSHQVNQMLEIIDRIHHKGFTPFFIYNTNGYDLPSVIDLIDPYIHIYLPDFKYASGDLAKKYSMAGDYTYWATESIRRMIYHKGANLLINDHGVAEWGIIVRHLVLPGHIGNSYQVLDILAGMSCKLAVSLMSQYHPHHQAFNFDNIKKCLSQQEYQQVVHYLEQSGFTHYFLQHPDSSAHYNPDFSSKQPFKQE